jgi:uncharacterized protein (TIGR04255 family)
LRYDSSACDARGLQPSLRRQLTATAQRPADLPDFGHPPLNEVVIGVQFAPPKGYSQVRAGEVWKLFQSQYPVVQERESLPPSFETFGLPRAGQVAEGLRFVSGALHDRFWFMRESRDELIQFQQDRLLHNWRKVGDQSNEYPRFERMLELFRAELRALEGYAATLFPQTLSINQCEISYINHITNEVGTLPRPSDWLRFATFEGQSPEDFSAAFREVIRDPSDRPVGRLSCECSSAVDQAGRAMLVLNLTVRGSPAGPSIDSALEFIERARTMIVKKFAELTTAAAHQAWERRQ